MSNLTKTIILGAVLILIGTSAKIGINISIKENNEYRSATYFVAQITSASPVLAVKSVAEIPDEKELKIPDNIAAKAATAIDLSSREKIFTINNEARWPLASITKLMSSIVALENMNREQQIVFSPTAIATLGTVGGFVQGESFSVLDMVNTMMVTSSNDAGIALAESLPEGQFVSLMNAKATDIGMHNTRFSEPTGLSMLNQSTVHDLYLLLEYAWNNHRELFTVSSRESIVIRELNSSRNRRLTNINALTARRDFRGGKTGFTNDANQTLVSVFSLMERPIAIIILGADDRVKETEAIISFIKNNVN